MSRVLVSVSCSRFAARLAFESENIQAAATAANWYALPPQTSCLWGKAKIAGTNVTALKIKSISARSRGAKTSKIPESMARPARAKQIPVAITQNSLPSGIHVGT